MLLLLLADERVIILLCQKVRLGFLNLNVRSVRTLAAFNITESISTLCLSLTGSTFHHSNWNWSWSWKVKYWMLMLGLCA
jgi:hypothetical protein